MAVDVLWMCSCHYKKRNSHSSKSGCCRLQTMKSSTLELCLQICMNDIRFHKIIITLQYVPTYLIKYCCIFSLYISWYRQIFIVPFDSIDMTYWFNTFILLYKRALFAMMILGYYILLTLIMFLFYVFNSPPCLINNNCSFYL